MQKLGNDQVVTTLLGAVAAAMLLVLAVEWVILARHRAETLRPVAVRPAPAPAAEEQADQPFGLPPIQNFREMVERPLFMDTRRPGPEGPDEPPPPPPSTPMVLKLMGVVWTPTGKLALMTDAKGKYKRLKLNDTLDGWTLVELGSDRVGMTQGDKRETVTLLKKRPKLPPGAPPPPPTPAGTIPRPGSVPPPTSGRPQIPQPPPVEDTGAEDQDMPEEEQDTEMQDEEAQSADENPVQ